MCVNVPPTFHVGRKTWSGHPVWYASAIIHDANHSRLFRIHRRSWLGIKYTPIGKWTGKAAERACLNVQLRALKEMGAEESMTEGVLKVMDNPTYQEQIFRDW
jgi:hypothetical protein